FSYYVDVARRYGQPILNGESVPLSGRLLYAIGNVLVYGPLKNVLGFSRVRVDSPAGEAVGPDLFSFYRSIGLNLKQLYGQTEAFLYLTAQPDGEIYSVTVGPACTNVDITRAVAALAVRTGTFGFPIMARCSSNRRACSPAISRTTPRPPR